MGIRARNVGRDLTKGGENPAVGVSIDWICRALRLGKNYVSRRLSGVKPVGLGMHEIRLYDLKEAVAHLVPAKVTLDQVKDELTADDLPQHLQETYWNAKLKEQRWRERAGELWRTEDVITLYGETLQDIRSKLSIIVSRAEKEVGIGDAQVIALEQLVSEVQQDIYEHVAKIASTRKIRNQLLEEAPDSGKVTFREMAGDDEDFI